MTGLFYCFMEEILNIILKSTYSLGLLKHRLRVLKTNLLKTFFGSQTNDDPLNPEDLNWLQSLPASFYKQFNKDNVYQIFAAFETSITKLTTLTLFLTFEPDETTVNQIGSYCRQNFNFPDLLLDIKLDPNLIAGTALVWKGVYRDYSLRAKIDSKKGEVAQEFQKFLR